MCMHVNDVGMVMWQIAPQSMQVACSKHLCVAWVSLTQQRHCMASFDLRWQVAALVARPGLAWVGSIPATTLWLR